MTVDADTHLMRVLRVPDIGAGLAAGKMAPSNARSRQPRTNAIFIIWITVATFIVQLLIAPIVPGLVIRFGKNLYQYCGLFTVIGGVALFFVPAGQPAPALLCIAIKGLGISLINTLMFAIEAETVDYAEWKTGHRSEGTSYAIFSFTRKITQSTGGALGAFALALAAYVTKLSAGQVQPESAITAIKATIGLVPAAAAIVGMICFIAYPLTEKRFADMIAEPKRAKQPRFCRRATSPASRSPRWSENPAGMGRDATNVLIRDIYIYG